jgi:hypothetical protein
VPRNRSRSSSLRQVNASELSQMGVCERRMVFERIHGQRRTIDQRLAIERGVRSHQRFYCDRLRHRSLIGRLVFAAFHRIARCVERWLSALRHDDGR